MGPAPEGVPALPRGSMESSWEPQPQGARPRVKPVFSTSASGKFRELSEDLPQVENIPRLHPRGKSPGLQSETPALALPRTGCVAWGQSRSVSGPVSSSCK